MYMFSAVYVEPNEKILSLLQLGIDKYRTSRAFSKILKIHESEISHYLAKRHRIPIRIVSKLCEIFNLNIGKVLINCKLYSQEAKESEAILFTEELLNLAWELSPIIKAEGHIEIKKPEISVKQEEIGIDLLYEIKNKLKKFIPQKIEIRDIKKDNKIYKELRFSCSVLKWVLNQFFDTPPGHKSNKISAKAEIAFYQNEEKRKYILSKYLETDGSFSLFPKVGFSCLSQECVDDIYSLMEDFRYFPRKIKNKVQVHRLERVIQCTFDILPYISHKGRLTTIKKWLENKDILLKLRIKNTEKIKSLLVRARNKIAKTSNKNLELAKYLSEKCKININRKHVNHWLHGVNPPLLVIIEICKLLGKNYFNYIPKHFALVLWFYRFITKVELEKIRGMNLFYQLSYLS